MADRIFAGVLLLVTLAYAVIAFTQISAPFQYDPLGPESWPQLLAVVAVLCILRVLWKPDTDRLDVSRRAWFRLGATVVLLIAYSELYELLGFILSTILFGTIFAVMLGSGWVRGLVFGLATGIGGWLLCVTLMDLNLPEGELVEAVIDSFAEDEAPAAEEGNT